MKNLILILNTIFLFLLSGCLENQAETINSSSIGAESKPVYSWDTSLWSTCSATACGTSGTQTRTVVCTKSSVITYDSFCTDSKPASVQNCSAPACPPPPPPPTSGVPSGAINVKDYGATANDNSDDTVAIQKAITAVPSAGTVYVPAGKYLVNGVSYLKLKSNMKFQMDPAAVLSVIPNDQKRYYALHTNGSSNLEISGGTLVGERNQHNYTLAGGTHEWGMGVGVSGGSNVKIHDMIIKDFTGDGIVIGGYANGILIDKVISTNNRRQGLSITRSDNITVTNSEFSYTNGTAPQYGIDIEPDPGVTNYHARGIRIENNNIHHNKAGAIQAYKETYDITIVNNIMAYNVYGLYTVQSFNGTITGNTFAHNKYQGISFHGASDSWTVSNNIFRNNSTVANGITNDTNTLTTLTGLVSGTSSSINKSADCTNIQVLTNQYAK